MVLTSGPDGADFWSLMVLTSGPDGADLYPWWCLLDGLLHPQVLGVVGEWSKMLTAVPSPLMVWSKLALGTYQLRFVSWVFHVIFSFVHFILLYTLGGLRAFRKPLPYNMYLFNLRIAMHILIKNKDIYLKKKKGRLPLHNCDIVSLHFTHFYCTEIFNKLRRDWFMLHLNVDEQWVLIKISSMLQQRFQLQILLNYLNI